MRQPKILCTGKIATRDDFLPLRDAGYEVVERPEALSQEELRELLTSCVGVIHGGDERIDEVVLSAKSTVRVIAVLAVGYQSYIDEAAARKFGIGISNTPGANSNAVAEFAITQLLTLKRRIFQNVQAQSSQSLNREGELFQNSVGIIGFGAIGQRVTEILRGGFDSRVLYSAQTQKLDVEQRLGVEFASKERLLLEVGSVVLCVPESPATRGMLGEAEFELMRPGSILVSISGPSVVSSSALLSALTKGILESAAFDIFHKKSDPNYGALMEFAPSRLLITSHVAYRTADACRRMSQMAVEALIAMLRGQRHLTTVLLAKDEGLESL